MTNDEIRLKLFELVDEKYKQFHSKLVPGEKAIMGVRVPLVKKLAKEVSQNNPSEYLKAPYTDYHEECLLYGLVIGYIKTDIHTLLGYIDKWVDCVNNWAVCDSGVMNMKLIGKMQNRDVVWKYVITKLNNTDKPFIKRVMIVIMFSYFNCNNYINKVLDVYENINDDNYYVKMAIAWGLCDYAIKHFDAVMNLFKKKSLDSFIQNKAIQKCCESFRLSAEQKQQLKDLKIL